MHANGFFMLVFELNKSIGIKGKTRHFFTEFP
jgi:hypothetical protein